MHYFPGLDEEKVLWHLSYTNLSMYLAAIPSYESDDEKEQVKPTGNKKPLSKEEKEVSNFFSRCF